MKIEILPTPADVAVRGADEFVAAVLANPGIVVALPTGQTPIEMYEILAGRRRDGEFSLDAATAFNLDEVLLPRTNPHTFFQFMTRYAWDPLGVPRERRFIPDGETGDVQAECERYESMIAAAGGLDLVILGIGADGHIAYNLPGQAQPRTHMVLLDPPAVASLGGDLAGPVRAITMGVETLLAARRIILLATGARKAEALVRMRDDPENGTWPCTFFRKHGDLHVIADEAAAAQL